MSIGRQPQQGQGIGQPDFVWLLGLAGGNNRLVQKATALAGGGQPGATTIGAPNAQGLEAALVLLNPVVSGGDSYQLPAAVNGKMLLVFNNTANSANIFASPNVNRATGSTDTINALTNVTAFAVANNKAAVFFCPADGIWATILTA